MVVLDGGGAYERVTPVVRGQWLWMVIAMTLRGRSEMGMHVQGYLAQKK